MASSVRFSSEISVISENGEKWTDSSENDAGEAFKLLFEI
jgi:hypothetical protein